MAVSRRALGEFLAPGVVVMLLGVTPLLGALCYDVGVAA
jgi:hypothetical protein